MLASFFNNPINFYCLNGIIYKEKGGRVDLIKIY
jgi:hypothetical protein